MRLSIITLLIFAVAVVLFTGCCKPFDDDTVIEITDTTETTPTMGDIVGSYEGSGVNPDGVTRYECTADITKSGEGYKMMWQFEGQPGYEGIGILKDNTFVVSFASSQGYGVVAYTVNPDGSLDGTWTGVGEDRTGTETLRKK